MRYFRYAASGWGEAPISAGCVHGSLGVSLKRPFRIFLLLVIPEPGVLTCYYYHLQRPIFGVRSAVFARNLHGDVTRVSLGSQAALKDFLSILLCFLPIFFRKHFASESQWSSGVTNRSWTGQLWLRGQTNAEHVGESVSVYSSAVIVLDIRDGKVFLLLVWNAMHQGYFPWITVHSRLWIVKSFHLYPGNVHEGYFGTPITRGTVKRRRA